MLWQVLVTVLIIWFSIIRLKQKKLLRRCNLIEADHWYVPVAGHCLNFIGSNNEVMTIANRLWNSIDQKLSHMSFWFGSELFIAFWDPINTGFLLKNCLDKADILRFTHSFIGNGSIFAPVGIWRGRRKALAPNFAPRHISKFVETFAKQADILMDKLEAEVGKSSFTMWPYTTAYTFTAVCDNALGLNIDAYNTPDSEHIDTFTVSLQLVASRIFTPWYHPTAFFNLTETKRRITKARKTAMAFVKKEVDKKLVEANNNFTDDTVLPQDAHFTMLERLLMRKERLTTQELCEEMLVMLAAGTDTSASQIGFTSLMLAARPDIQDKVHKELLEVFGDSTRPVTAEDLPRLKYLDCVIKETLRLYPIVPILARKVTEDVTIPTGETIPKNSQLVIFVKAIHTHREYWGEDAEEFRPERFLQPLKHPQQFLPFSDGPRNCVGYKYAMFSIKTALATLCRRYKLLLPDGADMPDIHLQFNLTVKDANNFRVKIQNR